MAVSGSSASSFCLKWSSLQNWRLTSLHSKCTSWRLIRVSGFAFGSKRMIRTFGFVSIVFSFYFQFKSYNWTHQTHWMAIQPSTNQDWTKDVNWSKCFIFILPHNSFYEYSNTRIEYVAVKLPVCTSHSFVVWYINILLCDSQMVLPAFEFMSAWHRSYDPIGVWFQWRFNIFLLLLFDSVPAFSRLRSIGFDFNEVNWILFSFSKLYFVITKSNIAIQMHTKLLLQYFELNKNVRETEKYFQKNKWEMNEFILRLVVWSRYGDNMLHHVIA